MSADLPLINFSKNYAKSNKPNYQDKLLVSCEHKNPENRRESKCKSVQYISDRGLYTRDTIVLIVTQLPQHPISNYMVCDWGNK